MQNYRAQGAVVCLMRPLSVHKDQIHIKLLYYFLNLLKTAAWTFCVHQKSNFRVFFLYLQFPLCSVHKVIRRSIYWSSSFWRFALEDSWLYEGLSAITIYASQTKSRIKNHNKLKRQQCWRLNKRKLVKISATLNIKSQ